MTEPIRCFEGETKPHEPFWTVRNAVDGAEPELELYGYISEYSWFDDDVTPTLFKDALYTLGGGGPVTIRMNSYGGDVIAASLIGTMIKDYPGHVTVQIDGIAASAATVVAVSANTLRMQETAYFMIHDPLAVFMFAAMNIEELTRMVDSLTAVKAGIVNAYETKTGLSRPRLAKMMTEETWLDAQRALDLGFVDEVMGGAGDDKKRKKKDYPENTAMVNALRTYRNLPEPVRMLLQPKVTDIQPAEAGITNQAMDKLRAEVKLLKE